MAKAATKKKKAKPKSSDKKTIRERCKETRSEALRPTRADRKV
jgi:hypothetical protein